MVILVSQRGAYSEARSLPNFVAIFLVRVTLPLASCICCTSTKFDPESISRVTAGVGCTGKLDTGYLGYEQHDIVYNQ